MKTLALAIIGSLALSSHVFANNEEWEDWGDDWEESAESTQPVLPITGFIESTTGYRIKDSNVIAEEWVSQDLRGRIQTYYQHSAFNASYKGELYYDGVLNEWHGINREAYIGLSPVRSIDIRIGRQPLTWGTGDLVFLNDFFPKDWVAFFSGYDQQYLKAPSDAIKVSSYFDGVNLDLVWTPKFDADNYITGEKLAYYSPFSSSIVAAPPALEADTPDSSISDGELAVRAYKQIAGVEYAAYFYRGYFKTPEAFDFETGQLYFPKLSSIGASARASILNGIGNVEYAYWNSRESDSGDNPWVPNSQSRFLLGYETEIIRNLTANFQYYVEYIHDYEKRKASTPTKDARPREIRQLFTTRWTLLTQQSNLVYSAFLFYSPSDRDFYLIPNAMYRLGDAWQFNAGANLLGGKHDYTLFGQMETNSNIYIRAKYLF